MPEGGISFDVHDFDEVESTNILVKQAIEAGAPEGYVVRAAVQTGGYGRQGRTWDSPRGGLYISVLLRPQEAGVPLQQLPTLGLAVALAVREAVASMGQDAQVKWPNDVLVAGTKVAGISCEAHAGAVCVGIGVDRDAALLDAVLDRFAPRYATWLREGFAPFAGEFNAHHALASREITVQDLYGNVLAEGVVQGVDAQGLLLVETPTGEVRRIASGEAHIGS